jgi:hypothetical protein
MSRRGTPASAGATFLSCPKIVGAVTMHTAAIAEIHA